MHLLNIFYGVFLVLLTLSPLYFIFRLYRLCQQLAAEITAKITAALAALRQRIKAVAAALEEVKDHLRAAGAEVEPLEKSLEKLQSEAQRVEPFTQKVTTLVSESFKWLRNFTFPIPVEYNPDFVTWKTIDIYVCKVPLVWDVHIAPPFKFRDISLDVMDKTVAIPGLIEVQKGFEQLEKVSTELSAVLAVVGDPQVLTHLRNAAGDFVKAGSALKSAVDLARIDAEIAYAKKVIAAMVSFYRPKVVALAWLAAAIVAAFYLNWAVENISRAVELIVGG